MLWPKLLIAGLVSVLIFFVCLGQDTKKISDIVVVLASVSGTMLGFLVASLSILISIADKPLIKNMKKTGHYQVLLREIYVSAAVFLATLIVSIITLFSTTFYLKLGVSLSVSLCVLAIHFFVYAGSKFYQVMTYVAK